VEAAMEEVVPGEVVPFEVTAEVVSESGMSTGCARVSAGRSVSARGDSRGGRADRQHDRKRGERDESPGLTTSLSLSSF
jgi:hypothetical protein